ncbi:MAG: 30S ribosomal protein S26e [Candidatus Bathyarchaeota archaeon]
MPKKRKSRGRAKGGKGSSGHVQCDICGSSVPRDKAKKTTSYVSPVDYVLAKELRSQGTYIMRTKVEKTLCISCAVHRGIVKVRAKNERHMG